MTEVLVALEKKDWVKDLIKTLASNPELSLKVVTHIKRLFEALHSRAKYDAIIVDPYLSLNSEVISNKVGTVLSTTFAYKQSYPHSQILAISDRFTLESVRASIFDFKVDDVITSSIGTEKIVERILKKLRDPTS